jgi:hypothetical protein
MGLLGVLDTVASVIPGYKTVKETAKGFFEGGLSGAAKGLLRGFSNDWALGIAAMFVPGGQVVGLAQLGLWGTNALTGALDSKHEQAAQNHSQGQQQQQQSPGYW